jgi:hypothetical protein
MQRRSECTCHGEGDEVTAHTQPLVATAYLSLLTTSQTQYENLFIADIIYVGSAITTSYPNWSTRITTVRESL